jgi:hypothetical protein
MIPATILACLLVFQEVTPFKAKEDFEVKLDLSFKQRTQIDDKGVYLNETRKDHDKRTSTALLPYVNLNVIVLKHQPEEFKVKITRDDKVLVLNKKISEKMEIRLNVGFTDDVKDGISGYKHELQFLSPDKKVLSRILIEFDKEGYYFVNGEKRGKV